MINYTLTEVSAEDGTTIKVSVPDLDQGGFSIENLQAAFSLIQHPTNWKYPATAKVPTKTVGLFVKAIEWFTGNQVEDGSLTIGPDVDGQTELSFKGYYFSIGA